MSNDSLTGLLKSLLSNSWNFFGITQVNSILTLLGIVVTIGIFVAPAIKAQRRKKRPLKLQAQKQQNHSPYVTAKAVTRPLFVGRHEEL